VELTEEDWRNRDKWGAYEEAVEEVLVKTSTSVAPWNLIEGNHKYWALVRVLSKLVKILSAELQYESFDPLQTRTRSKKTKVRS
jgi:polyphosphate kinase 2 (PPK2 family)